MALDLASLKAEILASLEQENFSVFFADSSAEGFDVIYWDVKRHPGFDEFAQAAKGCGATLMVFYERIFTQVAIDEMLEQLEESELSREDKRSYKQRLNELQKFEGFTCELEVFFAYGKHLYSYQVRTDWFEEFETIFADVTVSSAETYEEDEDDEGLSGYFSRN